MILNDMGKQTSVFTGSFFNLTSTMIFNVQIFLERDQLQKARKDEKMQDPQRVNVKLSMYHT